jgi:branched-chain amino acid aminotransferase
MDSRYLLLDGKKKTTGTPLIEVDNRTFRYGDGCFETLKVLAGRIPLFSFHVDRLFSTLEQLDMAIPPHLSPERLEEQIIDLATANGNASNARIRLTFFRGSGGLYDSDTSFPHWLIQSWSGPIWTGKINLNGVDLGIYPDARKSCDRFSNLKAAQFLAYSMAARWAKKNQCNDAVVLNAHGRVADTTISNLFALVEGSWRTPPLAEGPISGIMRRHVLAEMNKGGIPVEEVPLSVEDLAAAQEIFLTNVMSGIRWVKRMGNNQYTHDASNHLYQQIIVPLWKKS